MVRINLLPPEIVQKRKSEKIVGYVAIAGIVVLIILAGVYGFSLILIGGANKELQSKKDQAASLQRAAEAFAIFESKEADLATRKGIVEKALSQRMPWSRLFTEMSLVLPPDQWVTALSFDENGSPGVKLDGMALDPDDTPDQAHKSIARTLIRLADLEQLQNVWLTSSAKDPSTFPNQPIVQFSLSADIVKPTAAGTAASGVPAPPTQ